LDGDSVLHRSIVGFHQDLEQHWESLDVDLGVPELVAGLFSTKTWMAELGRQGGKAKSAAKSAASRANGKRGGRPRKVSVS
jgi:hypothetical protein